MNIFSSLFRRREQPAPGVPSSTTDGAPGRSRGMETAAGDYQERIVYVHSPETALSVSAVYRATNLRADTMSIMPVQYQKRDFAGGNYIPDMRGLGRRINYLLQEEPNPVMSAADLWRLVEANRLFAGNALVWVERDEIDLPVRLWLCRSGAYDVTAGRYIGLSYLSDHGYVTLTDVPRSDVLHFANTFRRADGVWGVSTLRYAIETLSLNKTLRAQAMETAAKGGRVKLILSEQPPAAGYSPISQGLFDKGSMDDYAEEIQQKIYSGHDVVVTRGITKTENISMNAAEMQMIDQLGLSYDDVARFWGVPRPLLMLDNNSHYNDYQNATMEFHTRTILPQKNGNEKEIARKLIGLRDYGVRRIHICEEPLLAMDPERRAKVDQLNLQTGAKTVNEIRAGHDMPTVEHGDVALASANLMTLDALIAKSDAATRLSPGTYTVPAAPEGEEQGAKDSDSKSS